MKFKSFIIIICSFIFFNCSNNTNTPEFIKKATGRYLYNSDEIVEVYFQESELYMKWRGATNIRPLKVDENTFFVKEMNEKIQFLNNLSNKKDYIVLVQKEENEDLVYNFMKLEVNENVPSEHLKNNEFDKATKGYLTIQKNDSLDSAVDENSFNSLGYRKLRDENFQEAIEIFKINAVLYPNSANVYDSLAEAYMKSGDTLQAITNYKKSLTIDSGNARAKKLIEKLEK